jgi:hypothetical protein
MRTSRTHFEQIPVETVKKIAEDFPEKGVEPALDEIAPPIDKVVPPQERWRDIAKQVQHEHDPNRMTELVTQLLREFDKTNLHRKEAEQQ